jgi:hypothetical protein
MSLTTLAVCKAYRGITGTEHDAELSRLILAVDGFVRQYCGRVLEPATLIEYYSPEPGATRLVLREWPVQSVVSVSEDPQMTFPPTATLDASTYGVDGLSGVIALKPGRTFRGGLNSVRVEYVAGYPDGSSERSALQQAATELVWLAHEKGDSALLGLQSRSIGDGRVDTLNLDWPGGVREILDSFRRRSL